MTRAVCAGVRKETFFWPANQVIWEVLLDVFTQKSVVTLEVLAEELTARRLLGDVGGYPYLMQVTGKIPTTAHAGYFIGKILEKKVLRDAIRIGCGMVEKAYSYSGDGVGAYLSPCLQELTDLQNGVHAGDEMTIQKAAEDTIKHVEAMQRGEKVEEKLVSWGFSDFDRIFYPMMPGELVIVAARPSLGKTTLADQIVLANALRNGVHCGYFSLEVTVDQKPRKFAQIMSGHSWRKLPKAHPKDVEEFLFALKDIQANKFMHCFYREQGLEGICARIRALHQQGKLGLAIIDYLQLMDLGKAGSDEKRNDAIGVATRRLKLLALELGIPIILLSQLNRNSERDNREPRLSDLRDSGNIEQDADRVLFIYRPAVDPVTGATQNLTDESKDIFYQEVAQAKGRDVGTFKIGMYFYRGRTTFKQIERKQT